MLFLGIAVVLPYSLWITCKEWALVGVLMAIFGCFSLKGIFHVDPNAGVVLTMFGSYKGTVKVSGMQWANPFYTRHIVSLKAQNDVISPIEANDLDGYPVDIGVLVVWQVEDTYKALYDAENYDVFVKIQTEAVVRDLAQKYPYAHGDDADDDAVDLEKKM